MINKYSRERGPLPRENSKSEINKEAGIAKKNNIKYRRNVDTEKVGYLPPQTLVGLS